MEYLIGREQKITFGYGSMLYYIKSPRIIMISSLRMDGVVRIAIVAFLFRGIYAGFCTTSYSCQTSCKTSTKYHTACGFMGWERCSKSRTVYKRCSKTCYKNVCCAGYSGSDCNIPSCFGLNVCPNGGTCQSPDTCKCPRGFSSPACSDIDECSNSTHGCQHDCENTDGSYRCTCRNGFILNSDLKACLDLNECNVNNGGCSHICNNNNGSFSCSCKDGYNLSADGRSCYDVDECSLGTAACSQNCTNTEGSFTCSCNNGYTLGVDRHSCEDVDECVEETATCEGYCNNTNGSYTCYCDSGFILDNNGYSCKDMNECDTGNGGCGQICYNEPGSYRCECRKGFTTVHSSTNSEVCKDIDECMESSALCSQVCHNTEGSFTCSCYPGFNLDRDGVSCQDDDDCEGVVCMNKGTCVDGLNKYTCTCETGFRDKHCETDINECEFANGGCQDLCENTEGSFRCSCLEERQLREDGFSCVVGEVRKQTVFERLKIPRQHLPKPCFTVMLTQCTGGNDITIYLSSTSNWYKLTADQSVMFTLGVVFVNVNNFSVPISIKGIEMIVRNNEFTLNYGVTYELTQGIRIESGKADNECIQLELVESDTFDFISKNSFMKTLLFLLSPVIPSWLKFDKSSTEVLSIQDTKSSLVYGRDMDDVSWCDGAPVIFNHLYTVFTFGTGFQLSVFGKNVDIPKPFSSRKFCLIVDLCQHFGGTVFLMLPEGSRDMLLDIDIFSALKKQQQLYILPRGIGFSLSKGINSKYHTLSGQLWNGDTMFTPIQPNVNFWIGGVMRIDFTILTLSLTFEGKADIYIGFPNVQTMLTSMFVEEWAGLMDIQLSLSLRLPIFGEKHLVTFSLLKSTVNAYFSIGGYSRQSCGDVSNPEGMFFSVMVELNPFKGIPFLEDFVFSSVNRMHLLMITDRQDKSSMGTQFSITNDILELDNFLNNATDIIDEALVNTELTMSNALTIIILKIKDTFDIIKSVVRVHLNGLFTRDIKKMIQHIDGIRQNLEHIRSSVNVLIDETEFIISEAKDRFIRLLEKQVNIIEENVRNITTYITNIISSSVGYPTGLGFKFTSDWTFLGLKFIGFDFEMIYSESDLFKCSRFKEVNRLLNGEKALRVLARSSLGYKLGRFLNLEIGNGLGMAFSTKTLYVLVQLQAHIQMLGMEVTGDIFISTKVGLYFYLEGKVWNTFLAQIDVVADAGKAWDELTFKLSGRFVASARKRRGLSTETSSLQHNHLKVKRIRRQVQTDSNSFQDSYLDGLKKVIRLISEEAQTRLTQVQNALTSAKNCFTQAQDWLDKKQNDIRDANVAFNNAVGKLEEANENLERTKQPLNEAMLEMENAKKDINNLCKIRTCKKICISGFKCKMCSKKDFFGKSYYPCCRFTNCMLSFPDPICVIANIACQITRDAAYLVLETAKIFVRGAMLANDIARSTVSYYQFVVDKSRAVLVAAEGILELAKIGQDVAIDNLEAAKVALEAVKNVIGAAAKVLQFVIDYGKKNVIDVKNCAFDITMSIKDLPVFEVSCEVNAFKLGWTKIKLKINFKNIHQSIWQAARATVTAIIDVFGEIFSSRKRRDIEIVASSRIYMLIRQARESDDANNTIYNLNKTIDLSKNISGFHGSADSDFESRVELKRNV
ncbi:uncharacterized protein LOC132726311 [Ruditapes philippinarum]|uniref:uncharacterized protein LOC132726311 n=1 Tax=Ruditapes philippinarum TaxID=129788 RepID=UPI00295A6A64|nr:uncharacterized protein LOC132726311 [Ruditapes philippinarum]